MLVKQLWVATAALAALGLAIGLSRAAEPISFGTGDTGSPLYLTALAIAKAGSVESLDIRPKPYKGTTQAVPFVDNGELDFGLESALALTQAYNGTGVFDGQPLKNLRLVATIYPFQVSVMSLASDPARSIADLKGRPLGTVYRTSPNISIVTSALLASAGLATDDVQAQTFSTVTEAVDQMVAGNLAAAPAGVGSSQNTQLDQSGVKLRILTTNDDAEALERLHKYYPMGRLVTVQPSPVNVGILEPTVVLEYDYYVYANVNTPDAAVVALIDSMVNGKDAMTQAYPAFGNFMPQNIMVPLAGVPYHPAAEAHYKELGLWRD